MEFYKREFLLAQTIAGYKKYKINQESTVFIYYPDPIVRLDAQQIYMETFEEALLCGVMTEDEVIKFMITLDLWSEHLENIVKTEIPTRIDDNKVELYKNILNSNKQDLIRQELKKLEERYIDLLNKRHQFDYITCGGIATYNKSNFITSNCTKYIDGRLYDWQEVDIHTITAFINSSTITDKELRELARTEPWHSMWNASKKCNTIFNRPATELSDEQRKLINYSLFYEQIYEHPECPHDSVIEDDDVLDGWVILQKREREKTQNKQTIESKITNPKIANSQEIFVVVDDKDIHKVEALNTSHAKSIKKQRLEVAKTKGEAIDTDFIDIKTDIAMQQNQMFAENMKRK